MSDVIDTTEFLKVEAAQKTLEILGCAGLVDLCEIDPEDERVAKHQAAALADRLLATLRPHLVAQILTDARLLAEDAAAGIASLDSE